MFTPVVMGRRADSKIILSCVVAAFACLSLSSLCLYVRHSVWRCLSFDSLISVGMEEGEGGTEPIGVPNKSLTTGFVCLQCVVGIAC